MNRDIIINKAYVTPTPFYIYDISLLYRTLNVVCQCSKKYNYVIHYALKANFEKHIIDIIKNAGLGVDCVSGNEVRYAIENGFNPSSIVFAGVGKTDDEIRYAIEQHIFCFNCESAEELYVIDDIAKSMDKVATVALRINPDIDPHTHRYISTGQKESKFGISYSEIEEILSRLPNLHNIKLTGLHFHIGSQITDLSVYKDLCNKVNDITAWFATRNIELTDINVGGGLGINYDNPDNEPIPDFDSYFAIFNNGIILQKGQRLHFELGRSIVGQCGSLITRVLFNKRTSNGKSFVIVDAGMTDLLRPALYQANHAIDSLTSCGDKDFEYTIGGPVCESSDIFRQNIMLPKLVRGDLLSIRSAGAYGMSMSSRYNMRSLPKAIFVE